MSHDPHDQLPNSGGSSPELPSNGQSPQDAPGQAESSVLSTQSAAEEAAQAKSADAVGPKEASQSRGRPRILIGSQRDPAAYRPRPGKPVSPARPRPSLPESAKASRGPAPVAGPRASEVPPPAAQPAFQEPDETHSAAPGAVTSASGATRPPQPEATRSKTRESFAFSAEAWLATSPLEASQPSPPALESVDTREGEDSQQKARLEPGAPTTSLAQLAELEAEEETRPEQVLSQEIEELREQVEDSAQILARDSTRDLFNRRAGLPPDLEKEFAEVLGDLPVEELLTETTSKVKVGQLEPESRHVGKVLAVRGENVFVELGLREQGIVPLKLFREPPEVGQSVEVRVVRFVPEEGVYELVLPAAAADVADWSDLTQGMLVEARVTGVNQGGLECEVNRIRGFIPISQIDIFRVEKPEEYVGQSFTCVVLEADPQRKNLVLSRRAVLEREREQAQRLLWDSLAPGQIREGVVRRLTEFGAFVDLGGVDGLLHVSQIAWGRIKHPSEVLREGQTIKVRIDKVDRENQRISLGYRDLLYNPWEDADKKYVPQSLWKGRVTRIMDFGAFVELEPGIEGLVHISELSLKRVSRVRDVVKEGDEVDVMVLAFDPQEKKISLSIRAALKMKEPEPAPQSEAPSTSPEAAETPAPPPVPKKQKPPKPLKGGLGSSPGQSLLDLLKK